MPSPGAIFREAAAASALLVSLAGWCRGGDFVASGQASIRPYLSRTPSASSNLWGAQSGSKAKLTVDVPLYVSGQARFLPWGWWGFALTMNSGEISYHSVKTGSELEYLKRTYAIQELYTDFFIGKSRWIHAVLGRERCTIGSGLVIDDFHTGLSLVADLQMMSEIPLILRAQARKVESARLFSLTEHSYLYHAEAALPLSFFEEISLSLSYFDDNDDGIARVFMFQIPGVFMERSRSNLFWAVLKGNRVTSGRLDFDGTFILNFGSIDAGFSSYSLWGDRAFSLSGPNSKHVSVRALATTADLGFALSDSNRLAAFLVVAGGAGDIAAVGRAKNALSHSFVSMRPYLLRPEIFFNGAVGMNLQSQTVSLLGVDGKGAGVLGLDWRKRLKRHWSVASVSALMSTASTPVQLYGFEEDFSVSWSTLSWFSLSVRANVLITGNAYGPDMPRALFLAGLGLDIMF